MSEFRFAKRMDRVSGEAIKEILSYMSDPNIISFGGGSPAKESYPLEFVREAMNKAIETVPYQMLGYGQTEGWKPLREQYLEKMVRAKSIKADLDNVAIGTGGTQGYDLVTQAFVDEGDVVLVESPTFLTAIMTLHKLGAKLVAVETDEYGIRMDDLEEKIRRYSPKVLYVIPTFQNPTGWTLPTERRMKVAELASRYDVIVIEDDPYCALRYRGLAPAPIKSYDESGHVVLLDSFSKIVSPGIRVGGMVAEKTILEKMMSVKQCCDTHSTLIVQEICAEFLRRGMLKDHLEAIKPIYTERLDAMLHGIEEYFPKNIVCTPPEGGLFVWVKLLGDADTRQIIKRSVKEANVAFVPGSPFFLNPEDGKRCMRLNFSSQTPDRIQQGIQALGRILCEECGE